MFGHPRLQLQKQTPLTRLLPVRPNMSKFFSLAALIVGGIIVADVLTHPQGTAAASSGVNTLWKSSVNGLLGKTA